MSSHKTKDLVVVATVIKVPPTAIVIKHEGFDIKAFSLFYCIYC